MTLTKDEELKKVIAGALLDGQNQIHDLYSKQATPEEVEKRMHVAVEYWTKKAIESYTHKLVLEGQIKELELHHKQSWYIGEGNHYEQRKAELEKELRGMK